MSVCVALRTIAIMVALAAVACGGPGEGGSAVRRLSIATGGTGGVFYPLGGGIAKIIGESIPHVEATAEVTAAGKILPLEN